MTGTEVATVQGQGTLALRGDQTDWTPAQRAALEQIGIAEASAGDQQVFLHVAQRVGLDPFAKQIYLIGRKDSEAPSGKKWTIQTGIDGFRVFAERNPRFAGDGDAEWCGEDGIWRDVWTSKDPPVAARFTVYRTDRSQPVRAVAHYSEYVQTKYSGEPNHIWKTKPAGQLAKCAEALAKRRAFPQDLASVYSDEEMGHVDNPPPVIVQAQSEREAPAEPDWDALIRKHEAAGDVAALWDLRALAKGMRPNDGGLLNRIAQTWQAAKDAEGRAAKTGPPPVADAPAEPAADAASQTANQSQMRRIFALLKRRGIGKDGRLAAASMALERDVTSFTDLTANDASKLISQLEKLDAEHAVPAPEADTEPTKGGQ